MHNKIALITDLHFGVRSGTGTERIINEYYRKFYQEIFIPYLIENNIETVICLGDTFDKRKSINFTSLETAKDLLFDPLEKNNIQLYCLVGNHDAPYKNHIRISSPKLLLPDYKNITVIDEPTELTIYGKDFLFVPWVCADNQTDCLNAIKKSNSSIMIGHLELSGFEMSRGQISEHGHFERTVLSKFDTVWSGHYHHKSSQDNITYLGNPYELTWSDYDDTRGFHVYDCDNDFLEFIQNPHRLFHKIFYNDEDKEAGWVEDIDFTQYTDAYVKVIVIKKTDFLAYDTLIHKLGNANPVDFKVIEDFSEFEESVLGEEEITVEDTLSMILSHIDAIATEIKKEPLKTLISEIYKEALTFDSEGE